jgi:hypothetical protein
MKPKYLVYPPSLCLVAALAYYLIPPIINLETLSPILWWHDFLALIVFLITYFFLESVIPIKSRLPINKVVSYDIYINYLITLVIIVNTIRLVLYYKFGLVSFLHNYAFDGGLIDIIKYTASAIMLPFLIYGWLVFKKKICIIFLMIEIALLLSTFSKVLFFKLVIIYFIVGVLLGYINKKMIIRYILFIFPLFFLLTILYASASHSYRSAAVESGVTSASFLETKVEFKPLNKIVIGLGNRFNLHKNHQVMIGLEEKAAELELISLEQLYLRLTFQSSKLEPAPYWGQKLIPVGAKTARVFPRNIILYEIGGIWLITIFAFFNAIYIFLIKIITLNWVSRSIGIGIYASFGLGYLMGDGGANPAVTIFNQIMFVITICLIFIGSYVVNFIKLLLRGIYYSNLSK